MKALDPTAVGLEGVALIEASAGTGKTHTITTLYLRLLLERRLTVGEILVVTYTKAATAELRDRVRRRLREMVAALDSAALDNVALDSEEKSADAVLDALCAASRERGCLAEDRDWLLEGLRGFDEAAIYTIHGFCQRTLIENAFECGVPYGTELVSDESALFAETVRDFWATRLYGEDELFLRHLRQRKVGLAQLEALARRAVRDPGLPLLPEAVALPTDDPEAAWRAALAVVRDRWSEQRDAILALLLRALEDSVLKKVGYKAEAIELRWGDEMEAALAVDEGRIAERCKAFKYFTPECLAKGTRKGQQTPEHDFFEACGSLMEADQALESHLDSRLLQLQLDLVAYARQQVRERHAIGGTQSFDDLLHRMGEALEGEPGERLATKIRARYPAALIDEFQDTDPVQYEIFRKVWRPEGGRPDEHSPVEGPVLFLIGDPKQAIYGFRGADVFAYLAAKADAAESSFTLGTNWRSDPGLIGAVNRLFEGAREPFVLDGIPFSPVAARPDAADALERGGRPEPPFELLFVRREGNRVSQKARKSGEGEITKGWGESDLPDLVAAELARFLAGDPRIEGRAAEPGDVAILCRSNKQTRALQEALRGYGILGVVQGDDSVFDASEARELERVLRAMAEPGSAAAVRAALATPILGADGDALLELARDEEAWERKLEAFRAWHRSWMEGSFVQAFHAMLRDEGVHARLLALVDGERRITNLLHLGELLHTASDEHHLGPEGVIQWLARMRADESARGGWVGEAAEVRLESDARAVRLVTVHKSKGLEYPIVYCPFLWDGRLLGGNDAKWVRFHDSDDDDRLKLDLGSAGHDEHLDAANREALAENLRLVYVAITRARHRCSVVWGHFTDGQDSALAYLLHQPPLHWSLLHRPEEGGDEVPRAGDGAGGEPEDWVDATRDRFGELGDDELLADLERLAAGSSGAIRVSELGEALAPTYEAAGERAIDLQLPRPARRIPQSWRSSSFSGLASGRRREGGARPSDEGRDYDALADAGSPVPSSGLAAAAEHAAVVRLNDFPAGAAAGTFLHRILEGVDFQACDAASLVDAVSGALEHSVFDAKWCDPLCQALSEVFATPLGVGDGAFSLSAVAKEQRLDELEFELPVASSLAAGRPQPGAAPRRMEPGLRAEQLADAFRRFGSNERVRAYGDRLEGLGFTPLTGHLRGFIDLVFRHEERWYVVDYKSNHLGSRTADYAPDRLAAPMEEHHYLLQYHLYLVALHRYLGTRLQGYDYERDMGGVYYLFLRGMSPKAAGCGVYCDRPPRALVEALSELLEAPGEPRTAGAAS
ncbi:MAG: UvrD-helicase domain-containing protein [Deltaproteobacteria bacterium]|nr:UvrD-helicase domain-containing protein [Deltaproteobacteria bacterium]